MNNENKLPISELTHELTLRQYQMNHGNIRHLMKDMNIPEYIALHRIAQSTEASHIYGNRTYLKDLSDKLSLSMRQISRLIGSLRDKGLVEWSHDGDGKDGTYVTITDDGISMLEHKEKEMTDFYSRVVAKFGEDNLISLLRLMKEFDTVMNRELEEMQEDLNDDELD